MTYALSVINEAGANALGDRLYPTNASLCAACEGCDAARRAYRHDIRPALVQCVRRRPLWRLAEGTR
jgi:hypothetical protein